MNGFEVTTTLTQADWRAYQMAWGQRLQSSAGSRRSRLGSFALLAGVSFALAIALSALAARLEERMSLVAFIAGIALSLGTIIFAQRRMQARATPDQDGLLLGRNRMWFGAEGIRVARDGAQAQYTWRFVQDATLTSEHLFVWIDRMAALIVPLRDLPAGADPQKLAAEIRAMAGSSPASAPEIDPAPAVLPTSETGSPIIAANPNVRIIDFIRASLRVLTFRSVDPHAFAAPDRTAVGILLGTLALLIGLDWLLAEPRSVFSPYGLLVCAWYALVALIGAWLASRLSEPRVDFRNLVLVAIVLAPIAVVVHLLSFWVPAQLGLAVTIIAGLYAVVVLERFLRSITQRQQPRTIAAMLVLICATAWVSEHFYFGAGFWYPNYDDYEGTEAAAETATLLERWRSAEKALFEQPERIRTLVENMERPESLESAAFFVGFAGMGEQRVFAGEIALADRAIAERFETSTRAIRLVNDRRDWNEHPFASSTALRYALQALAQRMDLEGDVLFLALSSHGSDKAFLSVSNSGLPLNNLTATDLADALQSAGIKRRVIIVSACYAGTFIEPLRNDDTIIIAAAAADRTSFGCSDDRDVTYFGEAFYKDALPTAANLRAAFENAKRLVADREEAEGKSASNPQAHFGAAIESYLEGWSRAGH